MQKFNFGHTKDGGAVTGYRLENSRGVATTILDYGCTVQSLSLPDARGRSTDVVLGYDTLREYEENDGYAGAVIGRFANRIGGGSLSLNGRTYALAINDGENHLHGGLKGFDKHIWSVKAQDNTLTFSRLSPDGEENYPGNLHVAVSCTLTEDNALAIAYDADTDSDTVVNLTNHSYFNLDGGGSVLQHMLQVFSDKYTQSDPACLTTGKILDAAGTPFDFREAKQLGRDIDAPDDIQLFNGGGYDHNYVLSDSEQTRLRKAAVLCGPVSGLRMTVLTTAPGLQVYSGNHLTARRGKNGAVFGWRDAICLETQGFPNATAYAHFPSPVLRAGDHYHSETVYRFDIFES